MPACMMERLHWSLLPDWQLMAWWKNFSTATRMLTPPMTPVATSFFFCCFLSSGIPTHTSVCLKVLAVIEMNYFKMWFLQVNLLFTGPRLWTMWKLLWCCWKTGPTKTCRITRYEKRWPWSSYASLNYMWHNDKACERVGVYLSLCKISDEPVDKV